MRASLKAIDALGTTAAARRCACGSSTSRRSSRGGEGGRRPGPAVLAVTRLNVILSGAKDPSSLARAGSGTSGTFSWKRCPTFRARPREGRGVLRSAQDDIRAAGHGGTWRRGSDGCPRPEGPVPMGKNSRGKRAAADRSRGDATAAGAAPFRWPPRRHLLIGLVLLAATFALYLPSFGHDFIRGYDDAPVRPGQPGRARRADAGRRRLGVHHHPLRQLAAAHLAEPHAGRVAVRPERRRAPRDQRRPPRRSTPPCCSRCCGRLTGAAGPAWRSPCCSPSTRCGSSRSPGWPSGRTCWRRRSSCSRCWRTSGTSAGRPAGRYAVVRRPVRAGADVQDDAGDAPVRPAAAGLVAAGAAAARARRRRRDDAGDAAGDGAGRDAARRRRRPRPDCSLEKVPLFALSAVAAAWTVVFQEAGRGDGVRRDAFARPAASERRRRRPPLPGKIVLADRPVAVLYPHPEHWPAWQVAGGRRR